eukprot:4379037-Pleurochrysis_carterae.AAC.1
MVMPIMPPTAECVVETGLQRTHASSKGQNSARISRKISAERLAAHISKYEARNSQPATAPTTHRFPYIRMAESMYPPV